MNRRPCLAAILSCLSAAGGLSSARAETPFARNLLYNSLEPCRLIDTRHSVQGALSADEPRLLSLAGEADLTATAGQSAGGCGIPTGKEGAARAIVLNLVALHPSGAGQLKIWASDRKAPEVPTLRFAPRAWNAAHGVVVPLGQAASGSLNLSASESLDLIADVVGYYGELPRTDLVAPEAQPLSTRADGNFNNLVVAGRTGLGVPPINKLDIKGAVAIGTGYAGLQQVPPEGLLVKGKVGINDVTPVSQLDVTASNNVSTAIQGTTAGENGVGVTGKATSQSGLSIGVYGETASPGGTAIKAVATSARGAGYGIQGETKSEQGIGVRGFAGNADGDARGVSGQTASTLGIGVEGVATAAGGASRGVYGEAASTSGRGVVGVATSKFGPTYGVRGRAQSPQGFGVYGGNASADGYAGYFEGKVKVTGNLEKPAGSFVIDHPLEPSRKVLRHSFVESPDMKNVYDGNVVLDRNGEALVRLPRWFQALNGEFRYQLTCLGGFAPVYIAEEIRNNRFKIAGGTAGLKVSWQVTGIRQDAYSNAHRIVVEEEKPAHEQGTFLYPKEAGQPETAGLDYQREHDASD